MKNTRNICNNNTKYRSSSKLHLVNRKVIMLFSTFILVMTLLFTVGITAIAKEEKQPIYKYYKSYMVEKDDTLLSIAYDMNSDECSEKQIKECVNEMISINSLDHNGTICYGNYIIVPYYSTEYR